MSRASEIKQARSGKTDLGIEVKGCDRAVGLVIKERFPARFLAQIFQKLPESTRIIGVWPDDYRRSYAMLLKSPDFPVVEGDLTPELGIELKRENGREFISKVTIPGAAK